MDSNTIHQGIKLASEVVPKTIGIIDKLIALPFDFAYSWLAPFRQYIMIQESNLQAIAALLEPKIEAIPEEKRISPAPYVAVPALQAASYSLDSEELREMYANLLASAMNSDTADEVHPSFVEIIKQLSPKDVLILNEFSQNEACPLVHIKIQQFQESVFLEDPQFAHNIGGTLLYSNVINSNQFHPLTTPPTVTNLIRLGLVSIGEAQFLSTQTPKYLELADKINLPQLVEEHKDRILSARYLHRAQYGEDIVSFSLYLNPHLLRTTPFFEQFKKVCLPKSPK